MKNEELTEIIKGEMLEKLYGFCYARTRDSYEAEGLCSDIVFSLVKASQKNGEIKNVHAFIWKTARNVYADFCRKRAKHGEIFYDGDPNDVLMNAASDTEEDDDYTEKLQAIYRRIAFLTKAYREVMILFYLDGMTTAKIAQIQNTSETAVRQRLFSAREKIRNEVVKMADTKTKPVALDNIDFVIWGTDSPEGNDPRNVCTRQLSKHIVWLCRNKPMRASEVAEKLNVPTAYVEEELEVLTAGENGEYGLLRRTDDGRYIINFILLDHEQFDEADKIYSDKAPAVCKIITDYIKDHETDYLSLPYLNHETDLNRILWHHVHTFSYAFGECVEKILSEKYFGEIAKPDRPFSVFGYLDNGKYYGMGCDTVSADNLCGYSKTEMSNIYGVGIQKYFGRGFHIHTDGASHIALRAIHGLDVNTIYENEKEHAAKAIERGLIYREGDMLYTKTLAYKIKDKDKIMELSRAIYDGHFDTEASDVARRMAEFIERSIPKHLKGEWKFACSIAGMPICNTVVNYLISEGILTPPRDSENFFIGVEK